MGSRPDRRRAGAGHGYPLGRGRPEDIPQSVRDAFHSTQEDQWDSPPESLPTIVMKSQMILLRTTLLRPDTPPEPNGTGEKEEITTWLTEGIVKKDAMARMDDARS